MTREREPTGTLRPTPNAAPKLTVLLVVRFLLELAMLAALGVWGWRLGGGSLAGGAHALFLPAGAAAPGGVFSVPNEPSRNPPAPVPVPAAVRLALE